MERKGEEKELLQAIRAASSTKHRRKRKGCKQKANQQQSRERKENFPTLQLTVRCRGRETEKRRRGSVS